MKAAVQRIIRDEKGRALELALILLLVGGLTSASLLGYMGSGLLAGEVYETRTAELYAADAGVEEAAWKILHQVDVPTGCGGDTTRSYNITDVNGKQVNFTITRSNNETLTYYVLSTATGDGSETQIEAYITGVSRYGDYGGLLDHIITIDGQLTEQQINDLQNDLSKLDLTCPVGCNETCSDGCLGIYDYNDIPEGCENCGAVYNYPDSGWPPVSELGDWYLEDVEDATHYYGDTTIDLQGGNVSLGPLYVEGQLTIKNSLHADPHPTMTLDGTLYITGDTLIGTTEQDFTLDLNGNTIFVASNTSGSQKALTISSRCTINGPGIIVSVGDVYFGPSGDVGSMTEPVFLFSVSVTAQLQPSNDWYGAIAGNVDVEVKSGETPTLTYPAGGFGVLNFPGMTEPRLGYGIESWEVTPL